MKVAAETVAIAVIYVLLGKLGQLSAITPGNVTAVWPPSGFALAMALLLGRKAIWGIGLGAFVVNTQAFLDSTTLASAMTSATVGIAIAVGSVAQPFLGALFIKRFIGIDYLLQNVRNLLYFTALIPLICVISSTIGASALWLGDLVVTADLRELWLTWWLGDGVGILIVTPFVMAWRTMTPSPKSASESGSERARASAGAADGNKLTLAMVFSLLAISGMIGFGVTFEGEAARYPLEFLAWPFLLWLALRFDARALTSGILLLSVIAISQTMRGQGPFHLDAPNLSLLLLQLFVTVTAVTTMIVGTLANERKAAENALRIAHAGLEVQVEARTSELRDEINERKRLEEQVLRSQKMKAVGQLTGGIAHDFNNILGIVMGNLELLQKRLNGDPQTENFLRNALRGTRRGAEITKKLLDFAREEPGVTRSIIVNDVVTHIQELTARSLTPSIRVVTNLAEDLWPVEIDPGDLEDAIFNLSLNAGDAMPDGGTLVIETANGVFDDDYAKQNPLAAAGDYVMISVSDSGTGMTDEVKEKAFEPFFTTKQFGEGSGLGLSMVYGFVERSNGHIKVSSKIDIGTTFHIYLPRAPEAATPAATASEQPTDLPVGDETILIVDDEEALLDVAAANLKQLGYKTLSAANGQHALEILDSRRDVNLLFCDVIMPGELNGYNVALTAHGIYPALKILLTSGFANENGENAHPESDYLNRLASDLLGKPYNARELAMAVRRALDGAG
jgi:signal transduction histidine kinase/CheY-like chemotaxis protein